MEEPRREPERQEGAEAGKKVEDGRA